MNQHGNIHPPGKYLHIGGPADGKRLQVEGKHYLHEIASRPSPIPSGVPSKDFNGSVEIHLYRCQAFTDRSEQAHFVYIHQDEMNPMEKMIAAYSQLSFSSLQRILHALRFKVEQSYNQVDKLKRDKKGGGKAEQLLLDSIYTDKEVIEEVQALIPQAISKLQTTGK